MSSRFPKLPKVSSFKIPKIPQASSLKVPKLPKVSAPTLPSIKIPKVPSLNSAKSGLQSITASSLVALKGRGLQIIVPILYFAMLVLNGYVLAKVPFAQNLGAGYGQVFQIVLIIGLLFLSINSNQFDLLSDLGGLAFFGYFTYLSYNLMQNYLTAEEKKKEKK
jgi:hypothetical protein